jgi:hypothetical protein
MDWKCEFSFYVYFKLLVSTTLAKNLKVVLNLMSRISTTLAKNLKVMLNLMSRIYVNAS